MKLNFRLRYHTYPGQSILLGAERLPGTQGLPIPLPLRYVDAQSWEATLSVPDEDVPAKALGYEYLVRNSDGSTVRDWSAGRSIPTSAFSNSEFLIIDTWNNPGAPENAYDSEPFRQVLLKSRFTEVRTPAPSHVTHLFRCKAPLLDKGQTLCLLGGHPTLNSWDTSRPILLSRLPEESFLCVSLDLSSAAFPLSYKYGVFDIERQRFVRFEEGPNRVLHDRVAPGKQTLVNDGFAVLPSPPWRGAGVAIPVFSLRSEESFGIGEFTDLKRLADWCALTGLKLIQLLPVNDTTATRTWADSYPYAAISAFALHPIYLNLARVANASNQSRLATLETQRQRLNALAEIDYESVLKLKFSFLRRIFPSQRAETFQHPEFREFFTRNKHWLVPYAAFCHLRNRNGTADFNQWPDHRRYEAEEAALLVAEDSSTAEDLAFYYFLQFHLHLQLREAVEYAHSRGIILKGDIPIGVYRYGADAWQHSELYHMELQAGAPPDPFSARGQNWGFPTYHWPNMRRDGFRWWRQRFEQMGRYFDAFRIDHILGFFRIWSIPNHAVEGILGYFVPALPIRRIEFDQRGILFDYIRLCRPYITDSVLAELFGDLHERARDEFLQPAGYGYYSLKPQFATQRQVETHFEKLEPAEQHLRLRQGLFDLISNVVLLEAETEGDRFHFRLGMQSTSSFLQLDSWLRDRLNELYIDYFYRRQDAFWRTEAMGKLPALKRATNMLVCGEDLGMVPDCVPSVMKELGLLGLEIQRMPKTPGREFSRPAEAPYLSVVTPSTHDMSPLRAWWEEDAALTQRFFNQELGQPGEAPHPCPGWVVAAIVEQHLASPAMWSIFQLQDLLGMDKTMSHPTPEAERINIPAEPKHHWCYRMHVPLEKLVAAEAFNANLRSLLQRRGR